MSIGLSTTNQTTIYQQNILKHKCIEENAFSFSKYKMEQKLFEVHADCAYLAGANHQVKKIEPG